MSEGDEPFMDSTSVAAAEANSRKISAFEIVDEAVNLVSGAVRTSRFRRILPPMGTSEAADIERNRSCCHCLRVRSEKHPLVTDGIDLIDVLRVRSTLP